MTNVEDLRREFDGPSRRFWIGLALTLVILLAVGSVAATPCWLALKKWRARSFLREAEAFIERRQLRLAMERARSALQLLPTNLDALRMNARLFDQLGSDASLGLWQRIVDAAEATTDDRAAFAEAALVMERPELVTSIMPDFLSDQFLAPRSSRIAAIYHAQAGHHVEAVRHARLAYDAQPSNATNAVLLAGLLVAEANPDSRSEARRLFWGLARTNGTFQVDGLRNLIRPDFATRADREEVARILDGMPGRDPEQDAVMVEARMLLDPSRTSQLASNLIARLPRDDPDRLSLAVGILSRQERHRDVLLLTIGDRGFRSRTLFIARSEALSATGQAEEAYRHAMSPAAPLPHFALERMRAITAQAIPDPRRRDTHLREMIRVADQHPGRLRQALDLAEAVGAPAQAIDAAKRLSTVRGEEGAAYRRLQRLYDVKGDTWTARDYARRAIRSGNADPRLPLEIAYFSLLLGEDFDRSLAEAERQLRSRPTDSFGRAVAALAHLRLDAPERARAVFEHSYIPDDELRPDLLAVLAATFGSNGLADRARDMARGISLGRLRPEERDLIRPWISVLPIGGGEAIPSRK